MPEFLIIKNDDELDAAMKRVDEMGMPKRGDPDYLEWRDLVDAIGEYEDEHVDLGPPDPVAAIEFRMEQAGLQQKDLIPFMGSASRVSEVLAGKRELSKEMIRQLHTGLGIPLTSLLGIDSKRAKRPSNEEITRSIRELLSTDEGRRKLSMAFTVPLRQEVARRVSERFNTPVPEIPEKYLRPTVKREDSMTPKAIYAGSFDLLTNGHLWMVQQGVRLFPGGLTVAVGVNPDKKPMFTAEERVAMIRACTPELDINIVELPPRALLVEYAVENDVDYLLRGVRTSDDFRFERAMRNINNDITSVVQTVALIPPRRLMDVSSSMVKGLLGCDGWENIVSKYVPAPVTRSLAAMLSGR